MSALDRRSFLIGAGASLVVLGGGSTAALLIRHATHHTKHLPTQGRLGALAAILGDPEPARRIGAMYVADHPSAPTTDPLKGVVTDDPRAQRQTDLVQPVRDRAHSDFFTRTLVPVAGWMLPQSIAELCAVAHRELG